MLSLQRYLLLLVLWITFFFNIERLHINKSDLINIAFPTYALVTALVVLGLVLPQWQKIGIAPILIFAFLSFVATKLLYGRPYWGEAYTYLTLFEFAAVLLTVTLSTRVGQLIADFRETVRAIMFSGLDNRVYPPEQAEQVAKREMLFARRRNYPLSMLLIEADTRGSKIKLSPTAQEIKRLLAKRMRLLTLTRLLAKNLRGSDSIVDESEQGRWLLMTAELDRASAAALLERLNAQTGKGLGVKLKFGIASYPDQGLTFEDLLAQAEQDLKSDHTNGSEPRALDTTSILAKDSKIKFGLPESQVDRRQQPRI